MESGHAGQQDHVDDTVDSVDGHDGHDDHELEKHQVIQSTPETTESAIPMEEESLGPADAHSLSERLQVPAASANDSKDECLEVEVDEHHEGNPKAQNENDNGQTASDHSDHAHDHDNQDGHGQDEKHDNEAPLTLGMKVMTSETSAELDKIDVENSSPVSNQLDVDSWARFPSSL